MSSSDLLDSARGNPVESGEATFTKLNDDVNVKPNVKLIGLTKEELEKYRNDPFWKAIRYAMFTLFWLVWVAMFAGAILIVVISPKCNKGNPTCGDELVNYRIFTPAFRDSDGDGVGDLAGVQEKLSLLKSIGISGISPSPLFKTADANFAPETVTSLSDIDVRLGGVEQLEALIAAAHDVDLCFIADLPLALSTQNTWALGLSGSFLEKKGDSGILDLSNAAVINALVAVAKRLVEMGVDGLRITTYGLSVQNNAFALVNGLIAKIRQATSSDENTHAKPTIFVEQSMGGIVSLANYSDVTLYNGDVANLEVNVNNGISMIKNNATDKPKPHWRVADVETRRFANNPPIQLLQLILPGPVSVYYGEDIGLQPVPFNTELMQRGAMRWNSELPTFGFSKNKSAGFYSNYTFNPTTTNFKDELMNPNSQLSAFKGATDLRLYPIGKFVSEKINGINYYARIIDDVNVPNFVLAVNWQSNLNVNGSMPLVINLPAQFTKKRQLAEVIVKAHMPTMDNMPDIVDFTKDNQVKLRPSEAVLFQLDGVK